MFGKAGMTVDFSVVVGCIHYVNMSESLFLLFHYLRQGTASLEHCYFTSEGYKKRRCFISKRWLINIFTKTLKLNLI